MTNKNVLHHIIFNMYGAGEFCKAQELVIKMKAGATFEGSQESVL
jgi:hypothetical protein